ncbi:MAG: hypothetical protein H7096_11415 [Flavobacterium sp.]|nr:hypothetical protein [Pedobacter sp.]
MLFTILISDNFVNLFAQPSYDRVITGAVYDENDSTLFGASVLVKNTQIAASTDLNGKLKIKVPSGSDFDYGCACIGRTSNRHHCRGDVYNDALAVALSENMTMVSAVEFACNDAALSVTPMGAQAPAPYKHELNFQA